ncbi:MAG: T9SS type A sorting domain-containing protein, partial [Bacteroidota bacterium]
PNTNPALQDSSYTDGEAIAFEIPFLLNQTPIDEIALVLYGRTTSIWDPIQPSTGIPRWDPNDPNREKLCWSDSRSIAQKSHTKRLSGERIWFSPNPASDKLLVKGGESTGELRLYNAQGQLLRQWELPASASQHKITIGSLPPGIYLLQRQIGLESDTQRIRLQ